MTQSPQVPGPADSELIREFLGTVSAESFAELVRRHVDLVYSAARSVVADRQLAEDVTQNVFLLLVRKAKSLSDRRDLAGWLYQAAKLEARTMVRTRSREDRRLKALAAQQPQEKDPMQSQEWREIGPHLNDALESLRDEERELVLMRYFQRRPYDRIAAALGVGEAAARQRVHRALERLRHLLVTKGVVASAAALGATIKTHAVQPAPAGLAHRTIEAASRLAVPSGSPAPRFGPFKSKALAALICGGVTIAVVGVALVLSLHRGKSESLYIDGDSSTKANAPAPDQAAPIPPKVRPPFLPIRAVSYDEHRGTRQVAGFVGYIAAGDWLRFNHVDLGPADQQPATFGAVVDCPPEYAGSAIEVHADNLDGPVLCRLQIESTGGYGKWHLISSSVNGSFGVHDLFLRFNKGGWNLDTIKITLPRRSGSLPIRASSYNDAKAVQTRGEVVCETSDGSWARYNAVKCDTDVNAIALTYACGNAGNESRIAFRLDRADGPLLGEFQVQSTGGWGSFQTQMIPVINVAGTRNIVLVFSGHTHGITDVRSFQMLHQAATDLERKL